MAEFRIGAGLFREMMISAANNLEHNKKLLNDLNVFPVPDGDTGTNMMMTLVSSVKEVNGVQSNKVGELVRAMGDGALKGARGNSGVILSQLFRGFARSVDKEKDSLTAADFADAIEKGVEAAYKAVMKPKEGTILTVARAMSEEAKKLKGADANLLRMVDGVIEAGHAALMRTPELLPVLKEAGVVDAGGAGLLVIYKGFKMAIDGEEIVNELDLSAPARLPAAAMSDISTANIEFMYCTEFFITNTKDVTEELIEKFKNKLISIGDSLVVVGDPELIKVHVHSNMPGKILQYALGLGELSHIKIENMKEQHSSLIEEAAPGAPQKPMAIVAVSSGDGLNAIFKDYKVDEIVPGGQSMNPSAEDIRQAIDRAPSDHVIVLPNNKNIILAAEQAKELTKKKVVVIPTKSFPQGLSCVLAYNEDASLEDNSGEMLKAMDAVKSAQVTKAIRDAKVGIEVKQGEYIGILEGDIVSSGKEPISAIQEMLSGMVGEEDAVITFYYGEDVKKEEAEKVAVKIGEQYPDIDVEAYSGGQPVYDYIISVE